MNCKDIFISCLTKYLDDQSIVIQQSNLDKSKVLSQQIQGW